MPGPRRARLVDDRRGADGPAPTVLLARPGWCPFVSGASTPTSGRVRAGCSSRTQCRRPRRDDERPAAAELPAERLEQVSRARGATSSTTRWSPSTAGAVAGQYRRACPSRGLLGGGAAVPMRAALVRVRAQATRGDTSISRALSRRLSPAAARAALAGHRRSPACAGSRTSRPGGWAAAIATPRRARGRLCCSASPRPGLEPVGWTAGALGGVLTFGDPRLRTQRCCWRRLLAEAAASPERPTASGLHARLPRRCSSAALDRLAVVAARLRSGGGSPTCHHHRPGTDRAPAAASVVGAWSGRIGARPGPRPSGSR